MKAYCPKGNHYPEEVIAKTNYELGVIVYGENGNISNRWEDGTKGIPEDAKVQAWDDDEPICPDHTSICSWKEN